MWFYYFQVQDLVSSLKWKEILNSTFTEFQTLIQIYNPSQRSMISHINKILDNTNDNKILSYQKQWNIDTKDRTQIHRWSEIWSSVNSCLTAFSIKFQLLTFIPDSISPPVNQQKYINRTLTWKLCGNDGTFLRCSWSCGYVSELWKLVQEKIYIIKNIYIPFKGLDKYMKERSNNQPQGMD